LGCGSAVVGPDPIADRAAVFDELWSQLDYHYAYFELKGVDWNDIGRRHRAKAVGAASDAAFAGAMADMLAELRDPHVALLPAGAAPATRFITPWEMEGIRVNETVIATVHVPALQSTSGGHIRHGALSASMGYLRVPSFSGAGWASEMDEALAALPTATTLVVDIRGNRGGSNPLALEIAGRFASGRNLLGYIRTRNGPRHSDFTDFIGMYVAPAGSRRFQGSVALLTDRGTVSAAEDFALALRATGRVTVLGDTTAGASGGPVTRELPNGWSYQFSTWVAFTPERRTFEGIGLAPEVVVRASPVKTATAFAAPERDQVIDAAVASLRAPSASARP
jgi:carboxyl-terminal processing protease